MNKESRSNELVSQINRRFAEKAGVWRAALRDVLGKLEAQMENPTLLRADEIDAMLPEPRAGADLGNLRKWVATIDDDRSQVNILKSLLQAAHEHAPRVCLFVVRGETITGWAALGFTGSGSATDDRVKSASLSLNADTVLRQVVTTVTTYIGGSHQQRQNELLFEALGNLDPVEIAALPLVNKGRVAAVLYADSGNSTEGIPAADALDILARAATMSIELIPVRGTKPAAQPAAAPQPAAAAPAQPAPRPVAPAPAPAAPVHAPAPAAPARAASGPDLSRLPPEEQKLHEAAKRFARLLVSEIKLYNEAKLIDARKNRDIYGKLKDDIERSKQMYFQRVNPKIAASTNYFFDELVNTLAEGDASMLAGYSS
jgi:hypothetical protein